MEDNCQQICPKCYIYDGEKVKTYELLPDGKMILLDEKNTFEKNKSAIFVGKSVAYCSFCGQWVMAQEKIPWVDCPNCSRNLGTEGSFNRII
jgi:hypothetical protein